MWPIKWRLPWASAVTDIMTWTRQMKSGSALTLKKMSFIHLWKIWMNGFGQFFVPCSHLHQNALVSSYNPMELDAEKTA
jgi:hypothetical protein